MTNQTDSKRALRLVAWREGPPGLEDEDGEAVTADWAQWPAAEVGDNHDVALYVAEGVTDAELERLLGKMLAFYETGEVAGTDDAPGWPD